METIEIGVELRQSAGKGAARAVRRAGKVPAILYGPKCESCCIAVDAKEFETKIGTLAGAHLIRLQSEVEGIGGRLVLVKETQRDPVTHDVLHADLYEVDVGKKIRLRVPLHFVGKAAGVELGGILQPVRRDVEVMCLPTEIPEFIEIDVSALAIHEAIHISELKAPPGVEIPFDADVALVTVLPPVVEEVKVAEAEEVEGEVAPPEEAEEEPKPEVHKAGEGD